MQTRHVNGNVTWIDCYRPTIDEISALAEEFSLHPILCEELLTPSLRQKVDIYDAYFYAIFQFPVPADNYSHIAHEIDFVVGRDFIITVRFDALDPLHYFSKALDAENVLERASNPHHAGDILWRMLRKLYESTSIALSLIGERIGQAEEAIYAGEERHMVRTLSLIRRDVLIFQRALRHHKSMLGSVNATAGKLFGPDFIPWTEEMMGEYLKVEEKLTDRKEMIEALISTNDSLLSAKTNISMHSLTILNTALLPAILISGVLSMNTFEISDLPKHSTPLVLIFMFTVSLGLFIVLKRTTERD